MDTPRSANRRASCAERRTRARYGIMCRLALAAALVLVLTAHARADLDAGISAYDRGDYATAMAEFRQAAEQGSVGIGVTGRPAMEPACVVC